MALVENLWNIAIWPVSFQVETDSRSTLGEDVRLTFLHNQGLNAIMILRLAGGLAFSFLAFKLDFPAWAVVLPLGGALVDAVAFNWRKIPVGRANNKRELAMNGRGGYFDNR